MNEPFNPSMWQNFAAHCGHPEADVSDPKLAARFLLSRLKSSVCGGRRAQMQAPQQSMYAPNGNPHFPQGFGAPAGTYAGYAQQAGSYRPMMNFGGFAQ